LSPWGYSLISRRPGPVSRQGNAFVEPEEIPEKESSSMAKLIIEPKKTKDGQIEYIVNYHDPRSDNSFTVTTTSDIDDAISRLRTTLENEVLELQKK
jgi:hypothetical protein